MEYIYIYIKEINYFIDILGDSEYIAAEIKWEVMCAVTDKQAYDKWGKHNLPSLACAHENQTCNNFKDQGMILKNIKQ